LRGQDTYGRVKVEEAVDASEFCDLYQLMVRRYTNIHEVLYIPGGAGLLTSAVPLHSFTKKPSSIQSFLRSCLNHPIKNHRPVWRCQRRALLREDGSFKCIVDN